MGCTSSKAAGVAEAPRPPPVQLQKNAPPTSTSPLPATVEDVSETSSIATRDYGVSSSGSAHEQTARQEALPASTDDKLSLPPSTVEVAPPEASRVSSAGEPVGEQALSSADVIRRTTHTLWAKANANLRSRESDAPAHLQEYCKRINHDGPLDEALKRALNEKYDMIQGKDGVSQSSTRKTLRRATQVIGSTQQLVMGLSRLDPTHVAPMVLGGVYCLTKAIEGATDEDLAAMRATVEIPEQVALWQRFEERKMVADQPGEMKELCEKLSLEIIKMYEVIIVLLDKLMLYFDKNWTRHLGSTIMPQKGEWKELKDDLKARETNCNAIKGEIAIVAEDQSKYAALLVKISQYDARVAFKDVVARTGVDKQHSECCAWLAGSGELATWYTPGKSSVLWLNGTIGTGKTTAMARAVLEVQRWSATENDECLLAMFFFQKAKEPSNGSSGKPTPKDSTLSVETCLKSLTRQLMFDRTRWNFEPALEKKYTELQSAGSTDGALAYSECIKLLKAAMGNREVYIFIDGIDECDKPCDLLRTLKAMWIEAVDRKEGHSALHLMLASRSDTEVRDYFGSCLMLSTGGSKSAGDMHEFVEKQLDRRARLADNSMFFTDIRNFRETLQSILVAKAGGLFRWAEIQIDIFTTTPFKDRADIVSKLKRLNARVLGAESEILREEYDRLVGSLSESKAWPRVLKMLQLIACSRWPLSAQSIASAVWDADRCDDEQTTAKDVRRLLAGFVFEGPTRRRLRPGRARDPLIFGRLFGQPESYERHWHDDVVLTLAHASVKEYLEQSTSTAGSFTRLAQNTAAMSMCFTYMTRKGDNLVGLAEDLSGSEDTAPDQSTITPRDGPQAGEATSRSWSKGSPTRKDRLKVRDINARERVADFLYYATHNWLDHYMFCSRTTFASTGRDGGSIAIVDEGTQRFLESDAFSAWLRLCGKAPPEPQGSWSDMPRYLFGIKLEIRDQESVGFALF